MDFKRRREGTQRLVRRSRLHSGSLAEATSKKPSQIIIGISKYGKSGHRAISFEAEIFLILGYLSNAVNGSNLMQSRPSCRAQRKSPMSRFFKSSLLRVQNVGFQSLRACFAGQAFRICQRAEKVTRFATLATQLPFRSVSSAIHVAQVVLRAIPALHIPPNPRGSGPALPAWGIGLPFPDMR